MRVQKSTPTTSTDSSTPPEPVPAVKTGTQWRDDWYTDDQGVQRPTFAMMPPSVWRFVYGLEKQSGMALFDLVHALAALKHVDHPDGWRSSLRTFNKHLEDLTGRRKNLGRTIKRLRLLASAGVICLTQSDEGICIKWNAAERLIATSRAYELVRPTGIPGRYSGYPGSPVVVTPSNQGGAPRVTGGGYPGSPGVVTPSNHVKDPIKDPLKDQTHHQELNRTAISRARAKAAPSRSSEVEFDFSGSFSELSGRELQADMRRIADLVHQQPGLATCNATSKLYREVGPDVISYVIENEWWQQKLEQLRNPAGAFIALCRERSALGIPEPLPEEVRQIDTRIEILKRQSTEKAKYLRWTEVSEIDGEISVLQREREKILDMQS